MTYKIIHLLTIYLTVAFFLYLFYLNLQTNQAQNTRLFSENENQKSIFLSNWLTILLLFIAFIMVVASFYSPYFFTKQAIASDFVFSQETGQVGDTIGGLMNPFVALAGVFITGLAFYMQFQANQQQRDFFLKEQQNTNSQFQTQLAIQNQQNQIQKFESQFYELLRLHRDNVSEMRIVGYDFDEDNDFKKVDKITEGRKVFVTMKAEFESILSLYLTETNKKLNKKSYEKCYYVFFSGLDAFVQRYPREIKFIKALRDARKQHLDPDTNEKTSNSDRKKLDSDVRLNFNHKPFSGHSSRLGHYFRHLYFTVKTIVYSPIIQDPEEKMRYIRIIRAQLSNHEQILLFYNWLGQWGNNWESDEQFFFTEFKMIHNLPYESLYDNAYIKNRVKFLKNKKAEQGTEEMFEIDS